MGDTEGTAQPPPAEDGEQSAPPAQPDGTAQSTPSAGAGDTTGTGAQPAATPGVKFQGAELPEPDEAEVTPDVKFQG